MNTETHLVEEARIQFYVSPEMLADEETFKAVMVDQGRRLREMFSHVTTEPVWSEPEPVWSVDDGEDGARLVGRFFAGERAAEPPTLYMLVGTQRGVRA